jgi:hypothetical protein
MGLLFDSKPYQPCQGNLILFFATFTIDFNNTLNHRLQRHLLYLIKVFLKIFTKEKIYQKFNLKDLDMGLMRNFDFFILLALPPQKHHH